MEKRGYLLIEMVVAIAFFALATLFIAYIQGRIITFHNQATAYLIATTIAHRTLVSLQHAIPRKVTERGFDLQIDRWHDPEVPFTAYTITVSWRVPYPAKVILYGGNLHE